MSDVFTASNGTNIETCEKYGGLEVTSSTDVDYLFKKHVDALREWFQAERDEQLGWWRASPGFVVRPRAGDNVVGSRSVNVLNERLGITKPVWEVEESRSEYGIAARAYFDAHPALKPWQDARAGEAWAITIDGDEWAVVMVRSESSGNGLFASGEEAISITSPRITAGRRVWAPEEEK